MHPDTEIPVAIRPAQRSDLDAINHVVEGAVMAWARAARIKPNTLPDLRYRPVDLDIAMLLVVVGSHQHVLGVVACASGINSTSDGDSPAQTVLRLDGPYIDPSHDQSDIGNQLLDEAKVLARRQGRQGLVIEPRLPMTQGSGDGGLTIPPLHGRL